jgi:predicted nucleic acid-binding protein
MPDDCFADSNVLVYTLDKALLKRDIAFTLWRQGVTVTTQVVMEFTNVCLRKLKMSKQDAFENALNIMDGAIVKPITKDIVRLSFSISLKYGFSHWDSLVVASALQAGCTTLYSEDMQHGQVIEGKLTIINPFLIA